MALVMKSKAVAGLSVAALGILAIIAFRLLGTPNSMEPAPEHEDWLEAAFIIESSFEPGDMIRLEPFWMTAGRAYFGDIDGGKRTPFRILDVHRTLEVPWLMASKRLWVVAAVESKVHYWVDQFPGAQLLERWELENLVVSLMGMPEQGVAMMVPAELDRVEVLRHNRNGLVECRRSSGQTVFRCGKDGKSDVPVEIRQIAGGPRNCLVVKPLADEEPTVVRMRLPQEEGKFFLRFGNTVEAGRQKDGSSVMVVASQDGDEAGEVELIRRDYDLHEFVFSGREDIESVVELTITASDNRKREVCLDGVFVRAPHCEGENEALCRARP